MTESGPKHELLARLHAANPGWTEFDELIRSVESREFKYTETEYLGNFFTCFSSSPPLVFADISEDKVWPDWLPTFVPMLSGMNADDCEMSGGFARLFDNREAVEGYVFSSFGDEDSGFPIVDVPPDTYYFQCNSGGAIFFVNKKLQVLYPHSEESGFKVLDDLEEFAKTCIRQRLKCEEWFEAYEDSIDGILID